MGSTSPEAFQALNNVLKKAAKKGASREELFVATEAALQSITKMQKVAGPATADTEKEDQ